MPSATTLVAFASASLLLILLPGPAMIFLIARGLAGGRRAGAVSALGVESATLVYVVATACGLTAVVATSGIALSTIRYVGAAYLIFLGVRTIMQRRTAAIDPGTPTGPTTTWRCWRQGFLVGISNPKVALFFLAFFPQFVHAEQGSVAVQVLVLGAIFVAIGLVLDVTYGVAGGAIRGALGRGGRAIRRGKLAAGFGYVALGGWTAVAGPGRP
jgi:threonine/homoserine/homoserine lactone efflux protein